MGYGAARAALVEAARNYGAGAALATPDLPVPRRVVMGIGEPRTCSTGDDCHGESGAISRNFVTRLS